MRYNDLFDEQKVMYDECREFLTRVPMGEYRMKRVKANGGSGKTLCVKILIKDLMEEGYLPCVASFTGRAATQLSDVVVSGVTLHSILYRPVVDKDGNLISWTKRDVSEVRENNDFIIIDEGSMVPYGIWQDIKSCDLPMIVLGDHFQLPPVEPKKHLKDFNLMSGDWNDSSECTDPDSVLLTNRRTDSSYKGIIDITQHLRESSSMPRIFKGNGLKIIPKKKMMDGAYHVEHQFDIVLCGMNKTRHMLNDKIRDARGYTGKIPSVGEQVICLKNNIIEHTKVNNGEIYIVDQIIPVTDKSEKAAIKKYTLRSFDDPDKIVTVRVADETWTKEKVTDKYNKDDGLSVFGFGYCISVFKSQGGTFNSVLFYDEDVSFFTDQQRFRYTACSRAAHHLTIAI